MNSAQIHYLRVKLDWTTRLVAKAREHKRFLKKKSCSLHVY